MEELVCIQIKDSADPLLDKVEMTYVDSFPEGERRDFCLVRNLIEKEPRFLAYVLLKNNSYVGFITVWQLNAFDYVEHFAIDPLARNGGIGARALKQFLSLSERPIVLEVEDPEDEMSRRRVGFYERLGFVLNRNRYLQPPYRDGEPWLNLLLMSCGDIDLNLQFEHVKNEIHQYVYGQ